MGTISNAREAARELAAQIRNKPGFAGVGVKGPPISPVVVVYVETDEMLELPDSFGGFPVESKICGAIFAL